MNEPEENQKTAGERVEYQRCICCEAFSHLQKLFGVSPAVKQHLNNSRIEFLKAVRSVIDERIEHISWKDQRGTKVSVE
jgi:hypothetical protein